MKCQDRQRYTEKSRIKNKQEVERKRNSFHQSCTHNKRWISVYPVHSHSQNCQSQYFPKYALRQLQLEMPSCKEAPVKYFENYFILYSEDLTFCSEEAHLMSLLMGAVAFGPP